MEEPRERLLTVCLKALYAWRRHRLAIGAAIDCYQNGAVDTPVNAALIDRYAEECEEHCQEALDLHMELEG